MNLTFVETQWFTRRLKARLDDAEYRRFQEALLRNPELGVVMTGCGGLRKVRWGNLRHGKGKRGAFRIVYLWIPRAFRIELLDIYGKDEKDDLSPDEKRTLARLARQVEQTAIEAYGRSKGNP